MARKQIKIELGFDGTLEGCSFGDFFLLDPLAVHEKTEGVKYFRYREPPPRKMSTPQKLMRALSQKIECESITSTGIEQQAKQAVVDVIKFVSNPPIQATAQIAVAATPSKKRENFSSVAAADQETVPFESDVAVEVQAAALMQDPPMAQAAVVMPGSAAAAQAAVPVSSSDDEDEDGLTIDLRIVGFGGGVVSAVCFLNQLNQAIQTTPNLQKVQCQVRFLFVDPVSDPDHPSQKIYLNGWNHLSIEEGLIMRSADESRSSFEPLSRENLQRNPQAGKKWPILFLTYPGLCSDKSHDSSDPTVHSWPLVIAKQLSESLLFEVVEKHPGPAEKSPVEWMENYGELALMALGYEAKRRSAHHQGEAPSFDEDIKKLEHGGRGFPISLHQYFIDELHRSFFSQLFPKCYQTLQEIFEVGVRGPLAFRQYCGRLRSFKELCEKLLASQKSLEVFKPDPLWQELKWMRCFFPNTFDAMYQNLDRDLTEVEIIERRASELKPANSAEVGKVAQAAAPAASFVIKGGVARNGLTTQEENIKRLLTGKKERKGGILLWCAENALTCMENITNDFQHLQEKPDDPANVAALTGKIKEHRKLFWKYLYVLFRIEETDLRKESTLLIAVYDYLSQESAIPDFPKPNSDDDAWVRDHFKSDLDRLLECRTQFLSFETSVASDEARHEPPSMTIASCMEQIDSCASITQRCQAFRDASKFETASEEAQDYLRIAEGKLKGTPSTWLRQLRQMEAEFLKVDVLLTYIENPQSLQNLIDKLGVQAPHMSPSLQAQMDTLRQRMGYVQENCSQLRGLLDEWGRFSHPLSGTERSFLVEFFKKVLIYQNEIAIKYSSPSNANFLKALEGCRVELLEKKILSEFKGLLESEIVAPLSRADLTFEVFLKEVLLIESKFGLIFEGLNGLPAGTLRTGFYACKEDVRARLNQIFEQKVTQEFAGLEPQFQDLKNAFSGITLPISEGLLERGIEFLNAIDTLYQRVLNLGLSHDQYPSLETLRKNVVGKKNDLMACIMAPYLKELKQLAGRDLTVDSGSVDFFERLNVLQSNLQLFDEKVHLLKKHETQDEFLRYKTQAIEKVTSKLQEKQKAMVLSIQAMDIEHEPLEGLIKKLEAKKSALEALNYLGIPTNPVELAMINSVVSSLEAFNDFRKDVERFNQINDGDANDFIVQMLGKFRIIWEHHQKFVIASSLFSDQLWCHRFTQEANEKLKLFSEFYLEFMCSLTHYLVESDENDRAQILDSVRHYFQCMNAQTWKETNLMTPEQNDKYTQAVACIQLVLLRWGRPSPVSSFVARWLQNKAVLGVLSVLLPVVSWPWVLHAVISNHFRGLAQASFPDLHRRAQILFQASTSQQVVNALGGTGERAVIQPVPKPGDTPVRDVGLAIATQPVPPSGLNAVGPADHPAQLSTSSAPAVAAAAQA